MIIHTLCCKCLGSLACFYCKMPMFRRAVIREGGEPLLLAFQYVIHMILCVQMDFTCTFEANTKCNNINHVWRHFYKILVVLKYHWRPWANIFDTDITRCIKTYIKVLYLAFFGIPTNVCVKDIGSGASMVLQNY